MQVFAPFEIKTGQQVLAHVTLLLRALPRWIVHGDRDFLQGQSNPLSATDLDCLDALPAEGTGSLLAPIGGGIRHPRLMPNGKWA